jgi:hypothetical protein
MLQQAEPISRLAPDVKGLGANLLLRFDQVVVIDFEFLVGQGEPQTPVCMVARELRSGRQWRFWQDDLLQLPGAPWDTGPASCTVAYFASAELHCFRVLGWPVPTNIIDLFAEFRAETNGLQLPMGRSLLGALAYFGLSGMAAGEKEAMRDLILTGGPWSREDRVAILDYCAEDVDATCLLLDAMAEHVARSPKRLGHAVLRGRYMGAVAAMEHVGIPVDIPTFGRLQESWSGIQHQLVEAVDRDFGVYDGRTFKSDKFAAWLIRSGIPWPRLDSGQLALDDDTFRAMAKAYPAVSPLRELRHALSEMRLNNIPIGADGRNRTLISPFSSRTGRNQPSSSRFLFGTATWLRGLIKPEEGMAIAYLDFSSQEIAIAAALSGDAALWRAYASGDPYMQFAIDAGLAPLGATKQTHGQVRAQCKAIVLGVLYGMGDRSLATSAGMTVAEAREILRLHHETYRRFWAWAESNVNAALLGGELTTPFGWRYRLRQDQLPNPRSLLNWPMQAGGSDMLRLAATRIVQRGVRLCAPVHDAVLIEAPVDRIEDHVEVTRAAMIWASSMVLGGPACRVDADIYRFPDRYMDVERGAVMWNRVMGLIGGPQWEPRRGGTS